MGEPFTHGPRGDETVEMHPFSEVHPTVILGRYTKVWQFSTICEGVTIGPYCAVGSGVYIGRYTQMGEHVRIQDKAHITDHMVLGRHIYIGAGAVFMNDKNPRVNNPNYKVSPPTVEDFVSVGCNATILPGVRLGQGCMVGAGAVVTKDVAPWTTVVGNPAIEIGRRKDLEPEGSDSKIGTTGF